MDSSALRDIVLVTVLVGHDARQIALHAGSSREDVLDALSVAFPNSVMAHRHIYGLQPQRASERDPLPDPIPLDQVARRIAQLARFPYVKLIEEADMERMMQARRAAAVAAQQQRPERPASAAAASSSAGGGAGAFPNPLAPTGGRGALLVNSARELARCLALAGSKPVNLIVFSRAKVDAVSVRVAQTFERLSRLCAAQRFAKIDWDVLRTTPFARGVRELPALFIFVAGEVIQSYESTVDPTDLELKIMETENAILSNVKADQLRDGPLADLLDSEDMALVRTNAAAARGAAAPVSGGYGGGASGASASGASDAGEGEEDEDAAGDGSSAGPSAGPDDDDGSSAAGASRGRGGAAGSVGSAADDRSSVAPSNVTDGTYRAPLSYRALSAEVAQEWDTTTPLVSRDEKKILDRLLRRDEPEVKTAFAVLPELDTLVKLTLRFGVLIAKGFERTLKEEEDSIKRRAARVSAESASAPAPARAAAVVHGDTVAGAGEVAGHRVAHHTEPQEGPRASARSVRSSCCSHRLQGLTV